MISFLTCEMIGDECAGFGILVTLPDGEVKRFECLTTDGDEIERLCERINRLKVSECHLYEILDDFLM